MHLDEDGISSLKLFLLARYVYEKKVPCGSNC